MSNEENQNQNQLNIEISEEIAEGQYANLAIITHSHAEFVIDFVNVMPDTAQLRRTDRTGLSLCNFFSAKQPSHSPLHERWFWFGLYRAVHFPCNPFIVLVRIQA